MTVQEAIDLIKQVPLYRYECELEKGRQSDLYKALYMSIEALEKQMPKKPKEFEDKYYTCPECGNLLMYKWMVYPEKLMLRSDGFPYCLGCGQAIDWSDNE